MRTRVGNVLIVVEYQKEFFVHTGGSIHDSRDDFVDRLTAGTFQRSACIDRHAEALQCATQIGKKCRQMLVVGAEREPGDFGTCSHHGLAPLHEQRGFAEPRAAYHQTDRTALYALQFVNQPATRN
ncbi:hypothetical protein D3C84_974240 [compost metagenome]